jgi:hypothetical protein
VPGADRRSAPTTTTAAPPAAVVDPVASAGGIVAAAVVILAIWVGSRALHSFDAALIGYACATVFLAFGVVYRYIVWLRSPPARRWFRRGWASFWSLANFRRHPAMVPRAVVGNLGLQWFISRRGLVRWLAHQAMFWGVVLATLVTFPLVFGWIHFEAVDGGTDYRAFVAGIAVGGFDALSPFGWLVFHLLDVAAVLVIPGAGWFLWRRLRDREPAALQRLGHDLVPLVALIVISVTGLLLTFSSLALGGRFYDSIAVLHMAVVVLTLVYIPFGKFFHVIQRPASLGVAVAKQAALDRSGPAVCTRCNAAFETAEQLADLRDTMDELGLDLAPDAILCPRCKRVQRGEVYLRQVKAGFR